MKPHRPHRAEHTDPCQRSSRPAVASRRPRTSAVVAVVTLLSSVVPAAVSAGALGQQDVLAPSAVALEAPAARPVDGVRAFESTLGELGKDATIHVYEGAEHAFANPSGTRYNAEAAEDAWSKTLEFFGEHLRNSREDAGE